MLTWSDESFSTMERVIDKYKPTKDAIAENKFKGSFRRIKNQESRNKISMPYRRVQQQSDRGSIKDLANWDDEKYPPTPEELRLKSLYEHGLAIRDQALIDSLGLIAIEGAPKDPIALFRHREYVNSLKAKLADQVAQAAGEVAELITQESYTQSQEVRRAQDRQKNSLDIITSTDLVKMAGNGSPRRSFRRII